MQIFLGIGYVLFYPATKAAKSFYNIATGYKMMRSLFRFSCIFIATALMLAATGGFGIPGLTEWATPTNPDSTLVWHETLTLTYMVTYAASIAAKFFSQFMSAAYTYLFTEKPISYTNPDKYTGSYKQMNHLKRETEILACNPDGIKYLGFYFDPLDAKKQQQLNEEIKQLRHTGRSRM